MLIGLASGISPGTFDQILFGGFVSVLGFGLCKIASPYTSQSDNLLAAGLLFMTVSFYLRCLVAGEEDGGSGQ